MLGALIGVMTSFKATKTLLLSYPSVFSFGAFSSKGPSQDQLDATHVQFDFFAKGYENKDKTTTGYDKPDKTLHTQIVLQEPGYVFTPIAAITAALTLLDDIKSGKKNIPYGVLTPAAAFVKTDIVSRLQQADVKYTVL